MFVAFACLASGVLGAFIALAIDQPDVVVQDRIVEVPAQEPIPSVDRATALELTAEYIALGGPDEPSSESFVDEFWFSVCHGGEPLDEIVRLWAEDPAVILSAEDLRGFAEFVASRC